MIETAVKFTCDWCGGTLILEDVNVTTALREARSRGWLFNDKCDDYCQPACEREHAHARGGTGIRQTIRRLGHARDGEVS